MVETWAFEQAYMACMLSAVAVGWITMTVIDYRRLRRVHQRRLSR